MLQFYFTDFTLSIVNIFIHFYHMKQDKTSDDFHDETDDDFLMLGASSCKKTFFDL